MYFKTTDVAGLKIFYREAGDPSKPTIETFRDRTDPRVKYLTVELGKGSGAEKSWQIPFWSPARRAGSVL